MGNRAFYVIFLSFFGCVFVFTMADSKFGILDDGVHPLDQLVGTKVSVTGIVCAEPEARDASLKFCFESERGGKRILVTAARYPEYSYGDELILSGKLEFPEIIESEDGSPPFDYPRYLAKDGIRYLMSRPTVEDTGENKGNRLIVMLFALKSAFTGLMQDLFPEPESSLLAGILLGEKSGLSPELTDQFRNAGLVHILVLSGSNVTVVAEGLMKTFAFLPAALSRIFGAGSIILFALMTGASATTVRATIMALIVILAKSSARRYDVTRALVLAAFGMTLENPQILAFDASFQLSFLATLALIYVAPIVEEKLSWVTDRFKLREMLATTIGTQILTTPLILHMSGNLSIVSLPPNLLVLPLVPLSMLGGFVAVMVGFVSETLALPFAWGTSLVLSYIIKVTVFFGGLPFAAVEMRMSASALTISYTAIVWYLVIYWRRRNSLPQSPN
ncbi:MAG TPA: ComEC/Rec2 family competence protein [Candidatus Paceibacterota bacterium]